MKKLFIILLLASCTVDGSMAQTLHFVPKWKANDAFTYYFFKNKYNPKDSTYQQDKDTVIATLKVLKISNIGYEVELRYNYKKSLPPAFPPEGLAKVISEVKKEPVVLTLDTSGKYTGIKNWKDLSAKCKAKIAAGKKLAKADAKSTWDYWGTKVETQEQMEKYFAEDIEFFFMLYGSRFNRNTTFEYEDAIKSPYSSDYMAASTSLEVKDDPENKSLVEVKLFSLPDTKAAAAEIAGIHELIKGQLDNPDNYAAEELFDLQDYYVYLNNTETGTHRTAIYLRYLKEGPKETIESWKFILAD